MRRIPPRAHKIARKLGILERAAFWYWIEQRAQTPRNEVFSIYLPSLRATFGLSSRQLGSVVQAVDQLDTHG